MYYCKVWGGEDLSTVPVFRITRMGGGDGGATGATDMNAGGKWQRR